MSHGKRLQPRFMIAETSASSGVLLPVLVPDFCLTESAVHLEECFPSFVSPFARIRRHALRSMPSVNIVNAASDMGGDQSNLHGTPDFTIRNQTDRKSTRLNSSHLVISYAVFCLKKKKQLTRQRTLRYASLYQGPGTLAPWRMARRAPQPHMALLDVAHLTDHGDPAISLLSNILY